MALIHGFTQTSRCWGPLHDALKSDHEVVPIDAPGHGAASDVSADLDQAAELAFEAGGASTYLGYSMGGRIALHTALAHPHDVERLVLFHHDPYHSDAELEVLLEEAHAKWRGMEDRVCLAFDGMTLDIDAEGVRIDQPSS